MTTAETTDLTFAEDTKDGMCVVDFWATWCGPCKAFAPVFEESSDVNNDIRHLKMDVDKNPATASDLGVMSIPTLVFYKNGEIVGSSVGAMGAKQLSETLSKMRDV
jgi:thioredoxin 1